ncbi:MAG: transposase [Deltaproteobacteria bacterium]|nr:transposase [Deltaproteobacteria bacterium]
MWRVKESFQQFWEYEKAGWAGRFLDRWTRQVMYSRLEPRKEVAQMLQPPRTYSQLVPGQG